MRLSSLICLLAIQTPSFVISLTCFSTGCPYFSLLFVAFFLNAHILDMCIAKFFPTHGLNTSPFSGYFRKQKCLILMCGLMYQFLLDGEYFFREMFANVKLRKMQLICCAFKSFIDLPFMLRSTKHQEFTYVWCEVGHFFSMSLSS